MATIWLLPLFIHAAVSLSQETSASPSTNNAVTPLPLSARSPATCASKEINYITHTLPQQCLRTSRTTAVHVNDTTQTAPSVSDPASTVVVDLNDTTPQTGFQNETQQGTISQIVATIIANTTAIETQSLTEITAQQTTTTSDVPAALATQPAILDPDLETESALDSAKFLSFEDWKKENLVKAGQSPEHLGQQRASSGEGRRRPVDINALESLGEESEIDIDFTGFGGASDNEQVRQSKQATSSKSEQGQAQASGAALPFRGKDAGTTCKERFNYASFDCAATILKTNPKCKSSTSILIESKDSYMLNECTTDNKFTIVELCEDILVDTLVLANFEFFSSTFRTFRVSVSDRYPVKLDKWKVLGTFEARSSRDIQAFAIENPLIWARYLRIEFLTHYGNEYYCPVSLLRVHGTTMMEEFRSQDDAARGEDEIDEAEAEQESGHDQAAAQPTIDLPSVHVPNLANPTKSIDEPIVTVNSPEASLPSSQSTLAAEVSGHNNETSTRSESTRPAIAAQNTTSSGSSVSPKASQTPIASAVLNDTVQSPASIPESLPAVPPTNTSAIPVSSPTPSNKPSPSVVAPNANDTKPKPPPTNTNTTHSAPSSTQHNPPATPTTQESFYKTVHKRLQMLESNSSLSLQYIEEQSRILRDAFAKVEKRQTSKTERFLDQLNTTVLTELKGFRQQYDQLWQSTVIELETHRERHQAEMDLIAVRLGIMTEELVWQKRVSVAQSSLLLFFVFLVVFVRTGTSSLGLELPIVQQMLNKSPSVLRLGFDSPPESPDMRFSNKNLSSRPQTRSSEGTEEGDSSPVENGEEGSLYGSVEKPRLRFEPATPTEHGSPLVNGVHATLDEEDDNDDDTDHETRENDEGTDPNDAEMPVLRQTQSGPTTPSGRRDNSEMIDWDVSSVDELTIARPSARAGRKVSPLRHVLESSDGLARGDEDSGVK